MSTSTTREFHSKQRVTIITESGIHTGPGYVLVHGIGMGHRYWSALADELGKTGRVYALDLPAFGDAPEPPEPLDMQASGELLAELVVAERIEHVVGRIRLLREIRARWYIKKLCTMMAHRIEATMPHIRARTLVIRGEKDNVCPRDWVQRITTIIPHAGMREVPGRGHETMITGAEPVAKLIVRHVDRRL